ncbi:MAG: ABC transporter ATP-binding protein [Clostridia bacterium]|nr:ABC transporter ATP-binding protein [Clostridia bacterium]
MFEIKNLIKSYVQGKNAVDGVNLTVNDGEIFAFVGHNGAGKSTTIKCAVGAISDFKGEIYLDGISIKEKPVEYKKKIAYIADNPELYDYMTGISYLNFVADVYGVPSDERTSLIKKYSELFEIESALGDPVSSYSHGMKQKLAVISALVHKPKLIIMDEPFVGLDPKAAFTLKSMMKDIAKEEGVIIFFSTHVLEVAEKLCDRVAIIKEGKLVVDGSIEEVTKSGSLESVFMETVEN